MGSRRAKHIFTMIHIGEEICKELRKQERSQAWLARKLSISPSTLNGILRKQSIDSELLYRIGKTLGKDFFQLYQL